MKFAQNLVAEQLTFEVHETFTFDGVTEGSAMNPNFVPQYNDERQRSFCHDVPGTSERPSVNVDDDYKTMRCGSSDRAPDDGDDGAQWIVPPCLRDCRIRMC